MALTKLGVGRTIELGFGRQAPEVFTEAKVLLFRDGKDIEGEMALRGKPIDAYAVYMQRDPLGQVEVIVKRKGLPSPIRGEWPSDDRR